QCTLLCIGFKLDNHRFGMKTTPSISRFPKSLNRRRFSVRKIFVALFLVVILFILCAFIGLRWFEFYVTFHPQRFDSKQNWVLPKNAKEIWFSNKDNLRLHGWFITSASPPASGTVIYFHGNGGNISNIGWLGETLSSNGLNVLLF